MFLQIIQALLGFAFMASMVALIKPTLFKKSLTRKHVLIGMGAIIVLIAIIPTDPNVAIREQQQAEERQAKADARSEAEKAQAEQEAQAEAAKNDLFNAITITADIKDDSVGTPILYVDIKNGTGKTIDALTFAAFFENNFGDQIGKWNVSDGDAFGGVTDVTIPPGTTKYDVKWNLAVYDQASKVTSIEVSRVHFTDGTEISR